MPVEVKSLIMRLTIGIYGSNSPLHFFALTECKRGFTAGIGVDDPYSYDTNTYSICRRSAHKNYYSDFISHEWEGSRTTLLYERWTEMAIEKWYFGMMKFATNKTTNVQELKREFAVEDVSRGISPI